MTLFGKILVFVNLLLAALFVTTTVPVLETRKANQTKISALQTKIYGKVTPDKVEEGLVQKVAAAQKKLLEFRRNAEITQQKLITLDEFYRRDRGEVQTSISVLADDINDSRGRQANWKGSIALTETEIAARDAELKELNSEVEQERARSAVLDKEISELKAKLESATGTFQKMMADAERLEQDIATATKKLPNPPVASDNLAN